MQEAKRMQAEKSKTEKLLQAKLPPPLLTKSVEIQKEKVAMLLSYTLCFPVSRVYRCIVDAARKGTASARRRQK